MITADSASLSMLVLAADCHWRKARWWTRAAAWVFGRHRIVRHLGCDCRIGVWRGIPYLLSIREIGIIAASPTTPPPPKSRR